MTRQSSTSTIQMAPSLLSADFVNLERDIRLIEGSGEGSGEGAGTSAGSDVSLGTGVDAGAGYKRNIPLCPPLYQAIHQPPEWLHLDVMDGHFVPNLTIGPPIVRAIKRVANTPLDVHLMIDNPAEQLDWFIDAGADLITVHIECAGGSAGSKRMHAPGQSHSIQTVENPELVSAMLARIHAAGRQAGLSLNPGTPAATVMPFLAELDVVLVMSVHPGFGGQSFISGTVEKIVAIAAALHDLSDQDVAPTIEVDGGINAQTAPLATAAGARMLVAGNAVFGAPDPCEALQRIREAGER